MEHRAQLRARLLRGALAGIAVATLAAFFARDRLLEVAIEQTARAALADRTPLEDGDLHIVLCGTGLPAMDPAGRSACSAVIAAGELMLVDVGGGSFQYLTTLRAPVQELSSIFVSHFHGDHIGGLGDAISLSAFMGRERPLTVYGPPGIEAVVKGFVQAYAEDARLRADPNGGFVEPRFMQPRTEVIEVDGDASAIVLERPGLRVRAFAVDHWPVDVALGYRFDYAGRSVVFSGDTRRDDRLAVHARGADVLVHSAMGLEWIAKRVVPFLDRQGEWRAARLTEEAQRVFSPPVEIAEVAQRAGVGQLVFSHKPPVPWPGDFIYLRGVGDVYEGEARIGRDGMRIDLAGRKAREAREAREE